jgi:RNA polymerase sigma-70 factor (ECF subfamily)
MSISPEHATELWHVGRDVQRRAVAVSDEREDPELTAVVELAVAAWPQLALPRARFVDHLRALLGAGRVTLATVHADELYLACACAAGDPRALAAFDHQLRPEVEGLARRWRLPRAQGDDVVQLLWQRLLVSDGRAPRITEYSGRGKLRNWVRMAASRMLVDLARRNEPGVAGADDPTLELASLLEPGSDLQLAVLKANLAGPVRAAIHQALAALEPRERNLLRYRFVHGLGVDDIARLHGLHRVSASRAITRARERLVEGLRAAIADHTGLVGSDADSVVRLCWSRLELSLERIL